ncbi:MAG: hypothetical protein WBN07_02165 [Woeseiaceae bacterium]
MPRDEDFGTELASRLTAKYVGLIHEVEWTYDAYLELDQLAPDRPYCKVSPGNYTVWREGRHDWREQIALQLTLVSAVGATDDEYWIGQWLGSWDQLIRETREDPLFDRHKPMSIDQDERYDTNLFHNHRRLLTQATLHYHNVEIL